MSDRIHDDIRDGDTERTTLMHIEADHIASVYLRLKNPEVYRSVRYPQGHPVIVIVMDGSRQIDNELQAMVQHKEIKRA